MSVIRLLTAFALGVWGTACASAPGAGAADETTAAPAAETTSVDPQGPRAPAPGATPTTAVAVDRLLDRSGVGSIISARGRAMTRRIALLAGDLTDDELERLVPAVTDAFRPDLLRADIASAIAADAPEGAAQEVLAFWDRGANGDLMRYADLNPPTGSLEEYARSLIETPPPEGRVQLIATWTEVQQAGPFFILLDQALSEAAHTVLAQLRPDAAPFSPLSGQDLSAALRDSFNASVVSFLYQHQGVPDDVVRAATEEFETDAGRWYLEAYSLAVAASMRSAAQRAVAALGAVRAPR